VAASKAKTQTTEAPAPEPAAEPQTTEPAAELTDPRPGPQGPDEVDLSTELIIQRRTPGGTRWPADGRFRWVFHVAKPVVAKNVPGAVAASDWSDEDGSMATMHAANKVATLQFAMGNGLSPMAEAELDQVIGADDEDAVTVDLVYAVDVVPASELAPEDNHKAYTPSAALGDLGGSTLAERVTVPEGHLNVGQPAE